MDLLVTYDVNTLTKEGRGRLRRVAKVCTNFGQRVQESVFEVSVNEAQRERMMKRLLDVIDAREDSLRVYRLPSPREQALEAYGRDAYIDFSGALVT
jgi:CRISPR-associated endoribonuclease Cas2